MLKKLLRGAENNTFSGLISRVSPATCRRKIFGSVDFRVTAPYSILQPLGLTAKVVIGVGYTR